MKLGKKGVIFTLISVIVIGILFIAVISDKSYTTKNRVPVTTARVKIADSFVKSIKSGYLEQALASTSYAAMYSLSIHLNNTNQFMDHLCMIDSVMLEGKLDNTVWYNVTAPSPKRDIIFWLYNTDAFSFTENSDNAQEAYVQAEITPAPTSKLEAVGQFITIGQTGILDKVKLSIYEPEINGAETVIVELRKTNCTKPGIIIDNASINLENYDDNFHNYYADFKNNILVMEAETYYIIVKSGDQDSANSFGLQVTQNDIEAPEDRGWIVKTDNFNNFQDIDAATGLSIMQGNTLQDNFDSFYTQTTDFLHLDSDINIIDFSISQTNYSGPWRVQVDATYKVFVNAGIASWNITVPITTTFPIAGMQDIYHPASTAGVLSRTINNADQLYWGINNLRAHIYQGTYKHEPQAPNFLMRMLNMKSQSPCCGIETIIFDKDAERILSYADYCYIWEDFCPDSILGSQKLYNVQGISNSTYNFSLELYHANQYNISGDDLSYTCC